MYFLTYEYMKKYSAKKFGHEGGIGLLGTIFAGGMAGIANWAVGMPADVLKSRLQTGNKSLHILQATFNHYLSHFQPLKELIRTESGTCSESLCEKKGPWLCTRVLHRLCCERSQPTQPAS